MSTHATLGATAHPSPTEIDGVGFGSGTTPGGPALRAGTRIDLVQEMLAGLPDATSAGLPYLMSKIVSLLRDEAVASNGRPRPVDRDRIIRSLDELERETARPAPAPILFEREARNLIDCFIRP